MKIVLDVNSNLLSVGFTFAKSTKSHKSANKTRSSVDRNEQDAEDTINREKFWKILKQRYSSLISKRKIIIFLFAKTRDNDSRFIAFTSKNFRSGSIHVRQVHFFEYFFRRLFTMFELCRLGVLF